MRLCTIIGQELRALWTDQVDALGERRHYAVGLGMGTGDTVSLVFRFLSWLGDGTNCLSRLRYFGSTWYRLGVPANYRPALQVTTSNEHFSFVSPGVTVLPFHSHSTLCLPCAYAPAAFALLQLCSVASKMQHKMSGVGDIDAAFKRRKKKEPE